MVTQYGVQELLQFIDMLKEKGLANGNTAQALRVAVTKVLAELSPDEEGDVRKVDIPIAIKRFNNRKPGALSPSSLAEYQRRLEKAVREFVRYKEDPIAYGQLDRGRNSNKTESPARTRVRRTSSTPSPESVTADSKTAALGLSRSGLDLSFPLRPDFLAQIVVPRDLKSDEAKRLAAFISTLAMDYSPN
jgi:hypothetical protein